jgi:hypothetical protein
MIQLFGRETGAEIFIDDIQDAEYIGRTGRKSFAPWNIRPKTHGFSGKALHSRVSGRQKKRQCPGNFWRKFVSVLIAIGGITRTIGGIIGTVIENSLREERAGRQPADKKRGPVRKNTLYQFSDAGIYFDGIVHVMGANIIKKQTAATLLTNVIFRP